MTNLALVAGAQLHVFDFSDDSIFDLISAGSLVPALILCLLAGFISFASPCVVPLVPGYLSYLAGLVGAQAPPTTLEQVTKNKEKHRRVSGDLWRVVFATLLFILGFTTVFVMMSVAVFGLIRPLRLHANILEIVGGVIVVVMGLVFIGAVPLFQNEYRFSPLRLTTWVGEPLLGAVFGLGWVPCLGPTLSAVIATSYVTEGNSWIRSIALIVAYCLGLGIPFLILAFGSAWAIRAVGFLRQYARAIQIFGGVVMVIIGLLLISGWWGKMIDMLRLSPFESPI